MHLEVCFINLNPRKLTININYQTLQLLNNFLLWTSIGFSKEFQNCIYTYIYLCIIYISICLSLCVHKWVCVKMCMPLTYGNQFSPCGSQGLNSGLQPCQKRLHWLNHFSLALLKTYLTETLSRDISKKRLYDMFCTFIYLIENLRFVSSVLFVCFCGSWIKLLQSFKCGLLCGHKFSNPLSKY